MQWTARQLRDHKEAARLLEVIKNQSYALVADALAQKRTICEADVARFILEKFEENNMVCDPEVPIVAFGSSAAAPHYHAPERGSKVITRGNVLLIDIWSKLNIMDAPYADITWMAWTGGPIPDDVQVAFESVLAARDAGILFLEENLHPGLIGHEVDTVVRGMLAKEGLDKAFIHGTGHHLSPEHVHGDGYNFKQKDKRVIRYDTGATIEPGVYFEGKFGIRSECDVFLSDAGVEITTPLQKDWIVLE